MKEEKTNDQDLMAYADGELEGAAPIRVLRTMAADPKAVGAVLHQQQLRRAVSHAMRRAAPATPEPLQDKVAQLAAAEPEAAAANRNQLKESELPSRSTGPIARIGPLRRWGPMVAAAVLVIGVFTALTMAINHWRGRAGPGASGDLIMAAGQVERFASRHVKCSTMVEGLHAADEWSGNVTELPGALATFLKASTYPALDLSSAGYKYAGTGECKLPGTQSVHLIYQANDGVRRDALSLWLRADDGRFNHIPEDKLHQVTTSKYPHPMLVWRHQGVIYYLMGDSFTNVQDAWQKLVTPF